jgi:dephospho-CoA kinase
MSKIILGFVGPLASGKEEAKKYLEKNYQAGTHRFSLLLRDILNRLYLPITRENMQNLSLDLRNRFGGDILARVIAMDVKNDDHEIIVVDGVRRMDDIVKLKDVPGFYLVAIDAEAKIRYDRLIKRGENADDNQKTFTEFLIDNQKEAEKEIPLVMAQAKYQIDNNGDFANLYRQIDKIIKETKKQYE